MPALAFYIDAPLQSWGVSSKFQYRETNTFPTKSAIVGMIAAAMGIDKYNNSTEASKLKSFTCLHLTVVRIDKKISKPMYLTDFHTVGGGYDKKVSFLKNSIPRKASGPPFGTVITHRSYLSDTRFIIMLEGKESTLTQIKDALLDPIWGIWFGRKACLPASPLSPQVGESRQAALDALLAFLPEYSPAPLEKFEYQEEVNTGDTSDGIFFQSDQPIAYGQHHGAVPRPYRARGIIQHRPTT